MTSEKKSGFTFDSFKNISFQKDERLRIIFGFLFLSLALVVSLSFFSFFFTWDEDQSVLDYDSFWSFIFDTKIDVANWGAKIGAILSNQFIHDWFGIGSFSLILIFVVTGFRLLNMRILPLRKTVFLSLITSLVVSISLGFVFGYTWNANLSGYYGYYIGNVFLPSLVGTIGTGFIVLLIVVTYVIYTFKNSLSFFKNLFKSDTANNSDVVEDDITTNEDNSEIQEDAEDLFVISDSEIQETSVIDEDEVIHRIDEDVTNNAEELLNFSENQTLDLELDNELPKNEDAFSDELEIITLPPEENIAPSNSDSVADEELPDDDLKFEVSENDDDADKADFLNYDVLGDFDPTLDLAHYKLPPLELLEDYQSDNTDVSKAELEENKNKIVETLGHYKIGIAKIFATIGPTITLYEIVPVQGIRINKIKNLEDDIALSLAALGIRIIAPIPGKGTIGIEVPNKNPKVVSMRSILASKAFQESKHELPIAIGKTIQNETYVFNLAKMPHLLVAGATGQGKSVGLNAILASLLYKKHPSQLKFVLIDPKKVELTLYQRIEHHFLAKLPNEEDAIITDTQKVVNTLNSLCIEMDDRYELLKNARLRNISEYNAKFTKRRLNPEKGHRFLPYIVVVIDEFADLIMTAGKEVELPLARLAQLARAIGIHLIIATQRPTTNIITGVIKANFPGRIAFRVQSSMDSRTILDTPGANQLIGKGDMLIQEGSNLIRIQCAFIDTPELEKLAEFIGNQQSYGEAFPLPDYSPDDSSDSMFKESYDKYDTMFEDAARLIVANQQGSTSAIQRKFSIGYNRAGRIIDQLEQAGIVGPFEGSKARSVLFSDTQTLEQYLSSLRDQGKF